MSLPSYVNDFLPGPRLPDGTDLQGLKDSVLSTSGALTALAGGGQPGATSLNFAKNLITVCVTNADSCILPLGTQPGAEVWVYNTGAADAAIFPAVGDFIDAGAVNIARTVATTKTCAFVLVRVKTAALGALWASLLTA